MADLEEDADDLFEDEGDGDGGDDGGDDDGDDDAGSSYTDSTERTRSVTSSTASEEQSRSAASLDAALRTTIFGKANRKPALGIARGERSASVPSLKTELMRRTSMQDYSQMTQSQRRRTLHSRMMVPGQANPENVVRFVHWAKVNSNVLFAFFRHLDVTGKYYNSRSVPIDDFVDFIIRHGFTGDSIDAAKGIFNMAPPHTVAVMNQASTGGPSYEITVAMLKKFMEVNSHLTVGLAWSPINAMKRLCYDSRGTYLRAWRLDIDLVKSGSVPFMTFVQACHKLQCGHKSQEIWNSFRPDGKTAPLEFSEFAPEEAVNLEAFTQKLWVKCQFNMFKAWEIIDVNQRLWVTESEFVAGATALGFEGNASLIYKGLDTYGFGRLWRRELEYLKTMFSASSRTPHGTPQIKVLRAWCSSAMDGPDDFLARLGMGDETSGRRLSADEFAAGLEQLEYPGDPGETAHLVSRASGMSDGITREVLRPLLVGERPAAPPYIQRAPRTPTHEKVLVLKGEDSLDGKRASMAPMLAPNVCRDLEKGWNDSVDDLCVRNEDRHPFDRKYFSFERPLRPAASDSAAAAQDRKKLEASEKLRAKTLAKSTALEKPKKGAQYRVSFKVEEPEPKTKKSKKDKKDKKEKKSKQKEGEDVEDLFEDGDEDLFAEGEMETVQEEADTDVPQDLLGMTEDSF